jgi:UDP-glucuronate 4-epimerase
MAHVYGHLYGLPADTRALEKAVGFAPSTPLQAGLERFAEWFKRYYGYA